MTAAITPNPTPRRFPVPRPADPADDDRFTIGLVIDVRDVLAAHGFPEAISGGDLCDLQAALFRYVYGTPQPFARRVRPVGP